ncbi:MAG: DegT/DnrJ/EryC1/StrS family aminotransferase, partial [Sphingopyxis sp.]|nr:DegT/DnrJ/EryC1/StrS family aminotransferase [Sphingopyxis sp.]
MTSQRNGPFFNYPALFGERGDEYVETLREVMARGAYIMQKDLIQFEEELADFLGAKQVIGVADGTVALTLSLKASGINAGDEVIV